MFLEARPYKDTIEIGPSIQSSAVKRNDRLNQDANVARFPLAMPTLRGLSIADTTLHNFIILCLSYSEEVTSEAACSTLG